MSGATVGPIHKKDVIKAAIMAQKGSEEYRAFWALTSRWTPKPRPTRTRTRSRSSRRTSFTTLEGHFTRHLDEIMERKRNEARDVAVFPSLFKISKNHVFNMKDPIILGG